MDKTKKYMMMSAKAEIQKDWKPENGDFVWHPNEGEEIYGCCEFPAEFSTVILSDVQTESWWLNWLWLPRQDQLQAIYLKHKAEEIERNCKDRKEKESCYKKQLDWMCSSFSRFQRVDTSNFDDLYPLQFTSMEQLWLAFVMKEKYNKIWDEKNWVKI